VFTIIPRAFERLVQKSSMYQYAGSSLSRMGSGNFTAFKGALPGTRSSTPTISLNDTLISWWSFGKYDKSARMAAPEVKK